MPTYNIATFNSNVGTSFTTVNGVNYTLIPNEPLYTYYSDPNQTTITSGMDPYGSNVITFTCGDNVTIIDSNAFFNFINLTSVILSNKTTTLGNQCFRLCRALTTITIPATVTDIDGNAFANCNALKTVYFLGKIPTFSPINCFTSSPIAYIVSPSLNPSFTGNAYFSQVIYIPPPRTPCFKEGSKILTIDGYVPVEKLRKGDLVQTLKHNYLPIALIGKSTIYNSGDKERIKDRLYTLSPHHYPDLTEDLILTGCHSILVNRFTLEQEKATLENYGTLKVTDGKGRLETYLDTRATPYKKEGNFTIYHLALENENYYGNYGIWANGLLVESCSKRYLTEISNMELIH